jgi:hypothetical protein
MRDRDSRARLGRKVSSDFDQMSDPMMPAHLQDLMVILLIEGACEPQPTKGEADTPIGISRRAA